MPGDQLEVWAMSSDACSTAWVGTLPKTGPVEAITLSLSDVPRRVRLLSDDDPVASAEAWLDGVRVDHAPSDANGRIQLVAVPAFRLRDVMYWLPWLHIPLATTEIAAAPDNSHVVQLTGFSRARQGNLRVLSPASEPIVGALVGVQRHVGFQAVGQRVTDKRGEVTLHARRQGFVQQEGGKLLWRYFTNAIIYADGFAPLLAAIPDGKSDVHLQPAAHRVVQVVDRAGAPVPRARIYLAPLRDSDGGNGSIFLLADELGRRRVPVLPGWTVRACAFSDLALRTGEKVPVDSNVDPLRLDLEQA